jgi:DNA-binding transcriptional regulator YiaG
MKTKKKSLILEAVYETASDLYACGLINEERMQEYKELCLEPEPIKIDYDVFECINQKYGSNREKLQVLINDLLRKQLNISQPVL